MLPNPHIAAVLTELTSRFVRNQLGLGPRSRSRWVSLDPCMPSRDPLPKGEGEGKITVLSHLTFYYLQNRVTMWWPLVWAVLMIGLPTVDGRKQATDIQQQCFAHDYKASFSQCEDGRRQVQYIKNATCTGPQLLDGDSVGCSCTPEEYIPQYGPCRNGYRKFLKYVHAVVATSLVHSRHAFPREPVTDSVFNGKDCCLDPIGCEPSFGFLLRKIRQRGICRNPELARTDFMSGTQHGYKHRGRRQACCRTVRPLFLYL